MARPIDLKGRAKGLLILGALLSIGATPELSCPEEVLGLYESVYFLNSGVKVTGLVDTGAELSSLDISLAKQLKINTPVTRQIYVRTAHGTQRRDIISLRIKIKNQVLLREFTLSDRRDMKQKVLIGRNALKGFLIDLNR